MCGQPIETRRIVYGRTARADLWFVHTATDRVPCDPADRQEHEANLRSRGLLRTADSPAPETVPEKRVASGTPPTTPEIPQEPHNSGVNDYLMTYFE
jgi:hypothetical protein